MLKFKTLS